MKKKKEKSALQEIKGVKQPIHLNSDIKRKIKKEYSVSEYITQIKSGNRIFLSKAITLIESNNPNHFLKGQKILKQLLPETGKSLRIGITGVPGVGKSTFIESLGRLYTKEGNKVAVLAVDPSSSLSKGSILGDKTRMEELAKDKNAYIRPTAAGNTLGGVARKTRETIFLCEAAGFNVIIIETVGVGQSETMVHSMTDFFLLLKLAGAGDELQGIKRGIIEMADLIVINKAEKDNLYKAKLAQKAFQTALHYFPAKKNKWNTNVMLTSALYNEGIEEVKNKINDYVKLTTASNYFLSKRNEQDIHWFNETVNSIILNRFYSDKKIKKHLPELIKQIKNNEITAFEAAELLLQI